MIQTTTSGQLLDGRYEIRSVLGGGASAVVYLARQATVDRDVAIKVIRPEVFQHERELERYLREARIIAALNHPHIVTLHDVGRLSDDRPYMVIEYVRGQSLNRLLRNDAHMAVDVAFQVFQQVADALAHAHRNGVVHRDIKPGNILIEHRSTGLVHCRVADFGVASIASSSLTHHGAFIGTPLYMAPEQAQGLPVTPRSDIYSLGVVMYRLLTGTKPFHADTPVALAMCHVTEPVVPLRQAAPMLDIPADLERVVLRCLEKDPNDRYPDCEALLEDLAEVRLHILPHLLGLSQESLEGPLLLDRPETSAARIRLLMGANAVALVACFIAGWASSRYFTEPLTVKVPVTEVVEVEIEVPVVPEETVVELVAPPVAAPELPVGRDGAFQVFGPEAAPVPQPESVPVLLRDSHPDGQRLEALVGATGIDAHWEGTMEGKPVELDLQSDGSGHVAGRLRFRSGPTWSSRDMVGRLAEVDDDRVRLTLEALDSRQESSLSATFERDHAWGRVVLGGKERSFAVKPR